MASTTIKKGVNMALIKKEIDFGLHKMSRNSLTTDQLVFVIVKHFVFFKVWTEFLKKY
jgi:hypothetical protein